MAAHGFASWLGLGAVLTATLGGYHGRWELAFALVLVTLACVLVVALTGPRE